MVESFIEERFYNKVDYARSINSGVALLVSLILFIVVGIGFVTGPPESPETLDFGNTTTTDEEAPTPVMCGQGYPCGERITSGAFFWIIMLLFPGLFMATFLVERDYAINE